MSDEPGAPLVVYHFKVRAVVSQVVDVYVELSEPSALIAQGFVTEKLDAGDNKWTQLHAHFRGRLTWHPEAWRVVSAESCDAGSHPRSVNP